MKDVSDLCKALGSENAAEALTKLTKPIEFVPALSERKEEGQPNNPGLPPIKSARELYNTIYALPEQIVVGLLHKGSKMVLGGGSKCYKTFCLVDLALSVAHGQLWWGMATTKGRVLYINFEIQEAFFRERLDAVATAKGISLNENDNVDVWTLRGHCTDLSTLMPQIIAQAKTRNYDLIIVDPIYKGMGGRDENSAGDINSLLNEIEKLAVQSSAAVVFGAHFSKGNQAGKESIDRISGSGVFARDPDSILVMTKHENEDTYTIEATLRNFKPIEPFCIRWQHPLMERDDNADPDKLKVAGNKAKKYTVQQLINVLGYHKLTTKEWGDTARAETGMGERTFAKLKKELVESEQHEVVKVEDNKWAVYRHLTLDERNAICKSLNGNESAEVQ